MHYNLFTEGGNSSELVQRSKMEIALEKSTGMFGHTYFMSHDHTLPCIAASFLHSRSWQGLEQHLGQTEVTMATEGMKGVAAGYFHEPIVEN